MMSNKKCDICNMCQLKQTLKSGWGFKSPPQDQLKKKRFRRRWHTLSIYQRCHKCFLKDTDGGGGSGGVGKGGIRNRDENEKARNCLMLTYFKDETEQSLKGQFCIEKGSLSSVDQIIEECPSKYKRFSNILRWELPSYGNRILYMLIESENEKDLWLKAFENFFQIQDQDANVEDEFEEKEAEKFQPETNSKLQRAIAASKKYRDKTPPFSDSTECDGIASGYDLTETSPPKRSGGSFISNETDEFEEEIPRGYSYLPPKRSSQSSRSSSEVTESPSGYNYLPPKLPSNSNTEDDCAEEAQSGYNYLPPKDTSPNFVRSQSKSKDDLDLKVKNYSYLLPQTSTMENATSHVKCVKSNERNTNYCNVLPPKPISPISTMNPWMQKPKDVFGFADEIDVNQDSNVSFENYSMLPPPKPVLDDASMQQKRKQKSMKIKSNENDMNYSYVPPPKPVTPTSGVKPWKIKETEENSGNENYTFVPPPKPISTARSDQNPWKTKEIEEQTIRQENYSFVPLRKPPSSSLPTQEDDYSILPPPKPLSPCTQRNGKTPVTYDHLPPKTPDAELQKGIKNMSVRQLSHEKYAGKSVLIQESNSTTDENYVNFQPIQQMKMVSNLKPFPKV